MEVLLKEWQSKYTPTPMVGHTITITAKISTNVSIKILWVYAKLYCLYALYINIYTCIIQIKAIVEQWTYSSKSPNCFHSINYMSNNWQHPATPANVTSCQFAFDNDAISSSYWEREGNRTPQSKEKPGM